MKRFILAAVLAIGCGGLEMGAEAAPTTKAAATCTPITAATKADARACKISISAGACSVVSGPCASCALTSSSATVVFNAPVQLTQALQIWNLPKNIDTPAGFAKTCAASQSITWTVQTSTLVGTEWVLTDQDPNNPP